MSLFVWIAILALFGLVVAILNGFLSPLEVHFRARLGDLHPPIDGIDAPFVGLALSGGGARAAVFAASGMEALHARGLLADITHVSSVSGGGFPAAYFAAHPVPKDDAHRYFAQMQRVVAHDYFWDTQRAQLLRPPRMFSPSRRLTSLMEALERPDFLAGRSFAGLPNNRAFFFNTVSYDTGQRFVFSNAALPPPGRIGGDGLPNGLRTLSFSTRDADNAAPPDVPLSLAVATSAAFPPYLGPMTLQFDKPDGRSEYWHLGDGGVVENAGIETLREAIYASPTAAPATIYAFDAGKELDSNLSKNTLDISIWSRDVTRLVDVVVTYAGRQRQAVAEALDAQSNQQINLIRFNYMDVVRLAKSDSPPDPKWLSWSGWPHVTARDRLESRTPADHLAKIPTALKITPLNQALIAEAAKFLVDRHLPVASVAE